MKISIYGINGKMGRILYDLLIQDERFELIGGIAPHYPHPTIDIPVYLDIKDSEIPDVIIDFSHPSQIKTILEYALNHNVPLVIATTGFSDEDMKMIKEVAEHIPIIYSPNYSIGVNVLKYLTIQASKELVNYDIEILEKHHNEKSDVPSGTAKMLADSIILDDKKVVVGRSINKKREKNEIGISSIRGGNIVGEHTVMFIGNDEVIEITHKATSKKVFAYGAIAAALFIVKQDPGLYGMDDLLSGEDNG